MFASLICINSNNISRIRGSCNDCDGGGVVMKIAAKKIKPTFSIFSAQFISPIEGPAMIAFRGGGVCGWLGDENHNRRNQTDVFDFFDMIFITHRGSCDDCDGREGECLGDENCGRKNRTDVFLHQIFPFNSFENLKFSKMLGEDTISRIRGSCNCDGGGGEFGDKNHS